MSSRRAGSVHPASERRRAVSAPGRSGVGFGHGCAAQAFISTVTGTLDGKGRVCIPAEYRDSLTAQGTAGV